MHPPNKVHKGGLKLASLGQIQLHAAGSCIMAVLPWWKSKASVVLTFSCSSWQEFGVRWKIALLVAVAKSPLRQHGDFDGERGVAVLL
jgi:hypothetical protein